MLSENAIFLFYANIKRDEMHKTISINHPVLKSLLFSSALLKCFTCYACKSIAKNELRRLACLQHVFLNVFYPGNDIHYICLTNTMYAFCIISCNMHRLLYTAF